MSSTATQHACDCRLARQRIIATQHRALEAYEALRQPRPNVPKALHDLECCFGHMERASDAINRLCAAPASTEASHV